MCMNYENVISCVVRRYLNIQKFPEQGTLLLSHLEKHGNLHDFFTIEKYVDRVAYLLRPKYDFFHEENSEYPYRQSGCSGDLFGCLSVLHLSGVPSKPERFRDAGRNGACCEGRNKNRNIF